MALTPEQAAAALDQRDTRRRGGRARYTPEQRAARQKAQNRAQADARQALAVLHRDEYEALYAAALVRRYAEMETPQ